MWNNWSLKSCENHSLRSSKKASLTFSPLNPGGPGSPGHPCKDSDRKSIQQTNKKLIILA